MFHTVLEDDDLSLFSPTGLSQYMRTLRWLGVDELRLSAEWKIEVPNPDSSQPPSGFRADRPGSYTGVGMGLLDAAVRAASAEHLQVIIDPAFSAPLWATSEVLRPGEPASHWFNTNVNVHLAAAWEEMLARRYSGTYTPPGQIVPLPHVQTFTLWNEPNNLAFLKPQWSGGIPVSADWYRSLVALAYPAIKRVSPRATVLIGNTSQSGADRPSPDGGVAPLAFIRRLACVDEQLRPVRGGPCDGFTTVPGDGYTQHPYERMAPPWVPSDGTERDWAQMGDLPRLQVLLDRLVAMHRLSPGFRNLWLTEQGYESNGQLLDRPWTESQQAQLNAQSEYLTWHERSVVSFSQFLLRDTLTGETLALRRRTGNPHAAILGTWTTGLLRENLQPKPALWMFRSPLVARIVPAPSALSRRGLASTLPAGSADALELWGRARPARSRTLVLLEMREGTGSFDRISGGATDSNGVFEIAIAMPAAVRVQLRFLWLDPDGRWQSSPVVDPVAFPLGSF